MLGQSCRVWTIYEGAIFIIRRPSLAPQGNSSDDDAFHAALHSSVTMEQQKCRRKHDTMATRPETDDLIRGTTCGNVTMWRKVLSSNRCMAVAKETPKTVIQTVRQEVHTNFMT